MSNTSITNVEITDTFQVWISKTNEVIDILNENVMLAGPGPGYIVQGNSTLVGSFTADSINSPLASLNAITTSEITRAGDITLPVNFLSPINVTSNQENLLTLQTTIGSRPILRFINGANSRWEIGQSTADANSPITIRVGSAPVPQLTLTQAGNLSVSGTIVSTGQITGNLTGNVTGNLTGIVTGTVSSISNHTTDALREGTVNQYFTTARARNSISAAGALTYVPETGVMTITDATIRAMFNAGTNVTYVQASGTFSVTDLAIRGRLSGGVGVIYDPNDGSIAIGQAVATTSNVTFNNLRTNGTIISTGAITSAGDVTAFGTVSDIRKKENIVKIENALDKVSSLNGYTFNYIGNDTRMSGVIAQELLEVLPEVVYEVQDENSSHYAVRHGNIVGLLIEAIKELKEEVRMLKSSR